MEIDPEIIVTSYSKLLDTKLSLIYHSWGPCILVTW
jgi:hypothetical protein